MKTIHLQVRGMRRGGCMRSVTVALESLAGVSRVEVDWPTGYVAVQGDFAKGTDALLELLNAAGYPAKVAAAAMAPAATEKSGECCG